MEAKEADKRRVYTTVRDLRMGRPSAAAALALLELPAEKPATPMERLLAYQAVTLDGRQRHDRLGPPVRLRPGGHGQEGLLDRRHAGQRHAGQHPQHRRRRARKPAATWSPRAMPAWAPWACRSTRTARSRRCCKRPCTCVWAIERLAFDTYPANKKLFDEHRDELPVDLILFVCESHIAAGGDENHDRVEDILRGWLVKFSEAKDIDDSTKASVQLLLAKNYLQEPAVRRGPRRVHHGHQPLSEHAARPSRPSSASARASWPRRSTTRRSRSSRSWPAAASATWSSGPSSSAACWPIAAATATRPATSSAACWRCVPNIELANQALFNLAEVYGAEQRYIDQLELLRTVGRLGRASKRWHTPGVTLSIVVQDSDLGVSRGHARIPGPRDDRARRRRGD